MAKSVNNIITHGLSGKIGDLLVFKQVDGKTIVSKHQENQTQKPKNRNNIGQNSKRQLSIPKP